MLEPSHHCTSCQAQYSKIEPTASSQQAFLQELALSLLYTHNPERSAPHGALQMSVSKCLNDDSHCSRVHGRAMR